MIKILLSILLISTPTTITAQENTTYCKPRAVLVKEMTDTYNEKQVSIGLLSSTVMIEVWSGTKTFTIILTDITEKSCVLMFGTK